MPTIEGIVLAHLPVGQRVYYNNQLAVVTKEYKANEGLRVLLDGDTHDRYGGGTGSLKFVWEESAQYVLELSLVTIPDGFIFLVVSSPNDNNVWEFSYSLIIKSKKEGGMSSPILTGKDPKHRSFDNPEDAKKESLITVSRLLRLDTL